MLAAHTGRGMPQGTRIMREATVGGRVVASAATAMVLVLACLGPAQADEDPTFSISLGAFFTDRDSNTRVDADTSETGTDVDLEGDLGFDRSDTVFRLDAYWRFAEKHRIDVSAFDLSRDSVKVIDRDIQIGDSIYEVDSELNSTFDLNIYKVAYTWSFLKREKGFLGLSGGLYIADLGASFSGSGPLGLQFQSRDLTAPLPVVGLRGEYHLSERWLLRGSAEVFGFEYNDFDGSLYDIFAGIDYGFSDTVAVGLGVNSVQFDLDFDDDRFNGNLDWAYAGAMLYLKLDF
jgi:hypothetical protein